MPESELKNKLQVASLLESNLESNGPRLMAALVGEAGQDNVCTNWGWCAWERSIDPLCITLNE